jgi:hypothetical protein
MVDGGDQRALRGQVDLPARMATVAPRRHGSPKCPEAWYWGHARSPPIPVPSMKWPVRQAQTSTLLLVC